MVTSSAVYGSGSKSNTKFRKVIRWLTRRRRRRRKRKETKNNQSKGEYGEKEYLTVDGLEKRDKPSKHNVGSGAINHHVAQVDKVYEDRGVSGIEPCVKPRRKLYQGVVAHVAQLGLDFCSTMVGKHVMLHMGEVSTWMAVKSSDVSMRTVCWGAATRTLLLYTCVPLGSRTCQL